jgi:VWFA-related protein
MLQRISIRCQAGSLRTGAIAVFVLLFTIFGAGDLLAQQPALTVKINGFRAPELSHAQAVITVLDSEGHPVSGLTKDSFTAQLGGANAPTVGLSKGTDSSLPLTVVLAIDASAAMQGTPIDQAKIAAASFVDGLGAQDIVAVYAFNDAVTLIQPFTRDHVAAHNAIDFLGAAAGSELNQATLQSVLQASATADTGRRAVVVLSGATDSTGSSSQEALFAAQALGVPVYGMGYGATIDSDFLRKLADVSGGQFTQTDTPDGLAALFQNVSQLLRNQYVLTIDASNAKVGVTQPVTLSITANAGDRSGSAQRAICPQRVCVALENVTVGEKLSAARTVTANVVSADPVSSVTFLVDGQSATTVTKTPYQFTFDPKQYPGGSHTIAAEVASGGNTVRSEEVALQIGSSSSGSSLMIVGAIGVLVIVALLFVIYFARRRRGTELGPQPSSPDRPKPTPVIKGRGRLRLLETERQREPAPTQARSAPLGRLLVTNGPNIGESYPIGSAPVSIGSGYRCTIKLPREIDDGGEIAPEFARIWVREDHLMVHELRRLTVTGPVGGRWEMLENGEVFSIGPCTFKFELGASDQKAAATAPPPPPDILRKEATITPPAGSEPLPDIFRSKEELGQAPPAGPFDGPTPLSAAKPWQPQSDDDSSSESPQAAAGP